MGAGDWEGALVGQDANAGKLCNRLIAVLLDEDPVVLRSAILELTR